MTGANDQPHDTSKQGTMYIPTALSVEGLFHVADTCPMRYDVANENTYLEFGAPNLTLSLMCTDQALIDIAHLANSAVRAMLHARAMPATDPIIGRDPPTDALRGRPGTGGTGSTSPVPPVPIHISPAHNAV